MLVVREDLLRAVTAHALAEHPLEACGVIAGPEPDLPTRLVPLVNAAHSSTFYEVAASDLLALYRDLDERNEVVSVVYHSHTSTAAYPSATDIALAAEPFAHYLLVSTRGREQADVDPEVRSFRIVEGIVTEEEIRVERDADSCRPRLVTP